MGNVGEMDSVDRPKEDIDSIRHTKKGAEVDIWCGPLPGKERLEVLNCAALSVVGKRNQWS